MRTQGSAWSWWRDWVPVQFLHITLGLRRSSQGESWTTRWGLQAWIQKVKACQCNNQAPRAWIWILSHPDWLGLSLCAGPVTGSWHLKESPGELIFWLREVSPLSMRNYIQFPKKDMWPNTCKHMQTNMDRCGKVWWQVTWPVTWLVTQSGVTNCDSQPKCQGLHVLTLRCLPKNQVKFKAGGSPQTQCN